MSFLVSKHGRSPSVLLVEDDEESAALIREALDGSSHSVNLRRAADAVECLAFLRNEPGYENAQRPDLVIVIVERSTGDWGGRQLLAELAKDADLRGVPVVMLGATSSDMEVRQMYELGCRSYIVKPDGADAFREMIAVLADYWFDVVQLPSHRREQS
ncbi:MAG: response regulator [Polyangiales bacterium]